MLLALSINNTHVVVGVYRDDGLTGSWRVRTNPPRTADEYAVLLRSFLADADPITDVVIGSVVPTLTPVFVELARRYLNVEAIVVGPGIKTGIRLLVENPREVGADRIANTLAAHRGYGGPAIVVDMGTATTFDVVSAEGDFLGGAIAPGVEISLQALTERAALLHRVDLVRPRSAIGKNTITNIQSGALFGYVGLVEGLVSRIKAELGPCRVIGTGGAIGVIAPETSAIDVVDQQLTLDGLRMLWTLNQ
ncbi:MAG TPA: type III pantothenate kinase [Chloroflexota bacterium]